MEFLTVVVWAILALFVGVLFAFGAVYGISCLFVLHQGEYEPRGNPRPPARDGEDRP